MVSKHYKNKRYMREKFINEYLNGGGKVIDSFIVNKGHPKGLERHCVTENGIIIVYNLRTNKLVTKLLARPNQVVKLYRNSGKTPSKELLNLCRWHEILRYNKI